MELNVSLNFTLKFKKKLLVPATAPDKESHKLRTCLDSNSSTSEFAGVV